MDTAAELILAEGLSALNMDNVRKAASVSGSQLTHYFADKQALIRAILTRQINVVLDFHRQPKLHGLESLDDFERWIDLNMRYLRRIGYWAPPPTMPSPASSPSPTTRHARRSRRATRQWVVLLEKAIQRMKDRGVLVADADPRLLALVIVSATQGGLTMAFTYRQEWPHADAVRFAVNCLRMFAADPRRTVRTSTTAGTEGCAHAGERHGPRRHCPATSKGLATRARIVNGAAKLMFERGVAGTSIIDVRNTAAVSGIADRALLPGQARPDPPGHRRTPPRRHGVSRSTAAGRPSQPRGAAGVGRCLYSRRGGRLSPGRTRVRVAGR